MELFSVNENQEIIMTKFVEVQGGYPGLVQQRIKKYPPQKKKNILHLPLDKR